MVGNQAGETTVFHLPAGTEFNIDVPGLHYNRKSFLVLWTLQLAYGSFSITTQHVTGNTRIRSNRTGFWANGTKTLLSRSLGVRGLVSVAGELQL